MCFVLHLDVVFDFMFINEILRLTLFQLYEQPRLILDLDDNPKPECQTEPEVKLESVQESIA